VVVAAGSVAVVAGGGRGWQLSPLTVKSHLARSGRKLGTGDRAHAVLDGLEMGLVVGRGTAFGVGGRHAHDFLPRASNCSVMVNPSSVAAIVTWSHT
jgi:hypothetical protein